MKFIVLTFTILLGLVSFKVEKETELTAAYVVKNQTSNHNVKGDVSKIIERRYSVRDSTREISNEFHLVYDELGQLTNYTMCNMTHYSDKSVMEKSAQLNYFYADEKLMMIESFSYRDEGVEPDSSEKSYIKYTYKNAKEAAFKAYRYNRLDHIGEVKIIDNQHATERIKYPNSKLKPVLYKKEYDTNFQLIKSEQNHVYKRKKKAEIQIFSYEGDLLVYEESYGSKLNYSYEFDSEKNWIKRTTTLGSGTVLEELEREMIYR